MPRKKVVVIGGGTGSYNLLRGLKKYVLRGDEDESIELTAIVTTMDSGGSSGVLRDEYGVLPPGDLRRCLIALSDETEILKKLFQYRFEAGKSEALNGHNFGNLFLTALKNILGSEEKAIEEAHKILKVRGRILPITLESSNLCAELEDGTIIKGETFIDLPRSTSHLRIRRVYLEPKVSVNKRVIDAINEADAIVIGPGDLFTSIIPNLLFEDVVRAIINSKAIKIYNCNIMTKYGETNNFSVADHFNAIEEYTEKDAINVVTYNNKKASQKVLEGYKKENAEQVQFNENEFHNKKARVIGRDLMTEPNIIRHDPDKIGYLIMEIVFKHV